MLNRAVGLAISVADLAGVHITFGQDDTRVDSRAVLIDIHGGHQAVGIYYACCRLPPLAIDTIIEVDRDIFSFLRSHSDSRPVRRGWPLRPAVKIAEPVYACGADSTASVLDEPATITRRSSMRRRSMRSWPTIEVASRSDSGDPPRPMHR